MESKMKRQLPWLWHGFFLAITLSMMELNTILPGLLSELTDNRILFGAFYSVLLGVPLLFNLPMSRMMRQHKGRRQYLLIGIYLRAAAFFGMAAAVFLLGKEYPIPALTLLLFLLFLFAVGGGLAGTAYSDLVGRTFSDPERGRLYSIRQFVMGVGALVGGILVARLLAVDTMSLWTRYAVFFVIGSGGLFLGSLGFLAVKDHNGGSNELNDRESSELNDRESSELNDRESSELNDRESSELNDRESSKKSEKTVIGKTPGMFREAWTTLKEDPQYARFILVENITSFSLMILPFYLVYARLLFPDYQQYLGAFLLLQIGGGLSSNFLWGWISAKIGNRSVIRLCIGFGAFMPLLAMMLGMGGPVVYSLLFFLVGAVTSGRSIGFEPYLLEIAPAAKRTIYIGLRGTLNLLDVILPLLGGVFIQLAGFPAAFTGVSVMMLLSLFLFRERKT